MASHVYLTAGSGEKMRTYHAKQRDQGYRPPPPDEIHVVTVGDLLHGRRDIVSNQQARLGYDAEGLALQIWCAGDTSLVQNVAVSIVGTREVSANGAARARRLARELSDEGIVVFS